MNSIADQIINSERPTPQRPKIFSDIKFESEIDELGLPVSAIDDYMIARILYIDDKREYHLHLRGDDIYLNGEKLEMRASTLIQLARWHYPLKSHLVSWLWERLKEFLPEYSRDKLVVAPGVTWDRAHSELTDEEETII